MDRRNEGFEAPVGREYAGPSGIARESSWLTHEDLPDGRDVAVEIARVMLFKTVKFAEGRERKNYLALAFKDPKTGREAFSGRLLGLNATIRKTLNKMFGKMAGGWKGKAVTLYVTECNAFGEVVNCVRVRTAGARGATPFEQTFMDDGDSHEAEEVGNGAEPAAEPEPATAGPDTPRAQFERALALFGLSDDEGVEILKRAGGSYDAAYEELQRTQALPEVTEPAKKGKRAAAAGELP